MLRLGRRHLPALALANLCVLGATAADFGLLVLLRRFVDEGLASPLPGVVGRLCLLGLGLATLREVAAYAGARLTTRSAARLVADLQERLFAHLHGLSLDFFQRSHPGDLVARIFHDTASAAHLVTGATSAAIESPVRLLVLFAAVFVLHPGMAAATTLVLVPSVVVTRLLGRALRRHFRVLNEELGVLYNRAYDSFGAAEMVKGLGSEQQEVSDFLARNQAYVQRQDALFRLQAVEGPLGQVLRLAALVAAFAYGGGEISAARLTPGALAAILVAAYAFLGALNALVSVFSAAQGGLAAAERLFSLLDEEPRVTSPRAPRPAGPFRRALRFESVSFGYPGRGPLLHDLSFALHPGEHLALVGPTGSGKTTILRLALRLFDPDAGRIDLDGRDLRELDPEGLRRLFAIVPQDAILLDRTLRENVVYGRPEATRAEIQGVIEEAGLSALVRRLPEGLETLVGARGTALSGGERQRIAIARAALRQSPILLLDEATSALDSETEREIQHALAALGRGRTTVTIAHRLSTLHQVDRVVVLEAGRVAESGRPIELLAAEGPYRRLWDAQGLR